MVATRRTRVSSSTKKSVEAPEIPVSSIRFTRRRTVIVTSQPQSEHTSDSQQDEAEQPDTAPAEPETLQRRETRRSTRQPTDKQPESSQEADVSESESCCSVASDIQLPSRSKRRATVRAKATAVDDQGTVNTDASSAKTPRRSMRVQKKPAPLLESTTLQEDEASEAESCSSVPPLSTRITRSCRRPAVVPEDVTHSEAESCSSVVSGPLVSTVRRSTRSRVKVIKPIPIDLEQRESAEVSTALEPRQTRGSRGKGKSAEEHQANDSDGCESGPSFSPRRRTRTASRIADSDSESGSTAYTSLDSPCGTRGKETPSSSRTGSASSNCAVQVSRSRSVGVTGNMPSMSSLIPKSVGKDAEETEPKNNQSATTPAVSEIGTKSDLQHVEEMEEETNNKTIIAADQDCSIAEGNNGDLTLTLDETEVQKQDVSSEAEDVEIAHEASGVRQVQAMEDESNSKPEMSEKAQHEPQSNRTEEPDTRPMISNPAEREDELKVLSETVETLNLSKISDTAADEDGVPVDQGAANKDASKDVKTQSSEASKMSTRKSEPMKGCISLLDSSEDEESNDGLSADGGNDMAGDLESEDEMSCSEEQPGSSAQHTHLDSGLFVIDTRPGCQPSDAYYIEKSPKETDDQDAKAVADEDHFVDEEGDEDDDEEEEEEDEHTNTLFSTRKPAVNEFSSSIDPGLKVKALGGLYINFDGSKSKCLSDNLKRLKDQKNQDALLKKSVIVPDFEKKDCVPPYKESKHAAKLKRRAERAKTTGGGWFNMRAPELTEDLKNDLKVLQMRSAIDPKRFYKKNDREGFPKYFQVGTVVDNPIDFYHSRIPKKDRKRTIVEELLADAEFRSFNKRKYREVMAEKAAAAAGKLNKKKKKINK